MARKQSKPQPEINQLHLFPDLAPAVEDAVVKTSEIIGSLAGSEPGTDLVDSIRYLGILMPIIVRRMGGSLILVDGRRRLMSAKRLEMETVPVRIIPEGGVVHHEAVTLQANTARRANPISEYNAIVALLDKGFTEKNIAKTLGIPAAIITQRMSFKNLIPPILELMETGRVAITVGVAAAKLPPESQEKLMDRFAEADRITMRDVGDLRKANKATEVAGLADVLFGEGDRRAKDAGVALSHIDAAAALLESHGISVNFATLREEVANLAAGGVGNPPN